MPAHTLPKVLISALASLERQGSDRDEPVVIGLTVNICTYELPAST